MTLLESKCRAGADRFTFVGADPATVQIRELAERVAPTQVPVLILGESGVGKEVLARFIHRRSRRAGGPFVKIHCAAFPPDLPESELAAAGTVLLDGIGELSFPIQGKLLQVVEEAASTRTAGPRATPPGARLIATTKRPLERAIADGDFREDLYFRLNAMRLRIPPLRERRQDIPLLCDHFVRLAAAGRSAETRIPGRLMDAFVDYHWPGNVRELEHAIQRYLIFPDVDLMLAELAAAREEGDPVDLALLGPGKISLKPLVAKVAEETEKRVILQVLDESRWNRRRAAARLDICYKTLLNKLHQWDLESPAR